MNFPNATSLHQEIIKFLYFLQTLAPIQLSSLWQFVQFEDKEQRWSPAQLISIAEKTNPQQLEQLMILTSANKRLDTDGSAETKQQLDALARELSTSASQLESFGSLFQMFNLQDLLHSFSFVQLLKFFEVIPSGSQMQQLQLIQQLQQLFGTLTPDALESLHQEVVDAPSDVEMHLLSHHLHLQPEHFHLYQPMRSLLHMEQHELRSFQDALPRLQPIQMLQLLQLLQLQPYAVVELKRVFFQNQSSANIVDPPFEFEPRPFLQTSVENEEMEDQLVETQRPTIGLQIVDQPPEKAVYKRNVKPNPSVQLVGEHMGVREGELYVVPLLLRCDTFAEEPRFLTGNKPMPITFGRVVTFRKLKVMVTSHQQQETLFSFRFELRRKIGEDEYEVIGSVTTNPICMLSHSTQMKPIATTAPTIMEVIPSTGPSTGGTRVAILGGNFADTPALRVRFDSTDVIPEFRGPGTLVCHTPQHTPGPVLVRVANGASAWSEGACTYTYALVARAHASQSAPAVPASGFPPGAQFSYGAPGGSPGISSPPSLHGFNFTMDISGISVGGGMLDALDEHGYAPLHYAAACGCMEQVRELLARGASVLTQDRQGCTPIHWAIAFNQFQITALLLTQATKQMNAVNACNLTGVTPLHWACAAGNQQLVSLLVEAGGALVNVSDEDGASPLHAAAAVGHVGIVKYLLTRGAFMCSEDEVGDTPLHYAIREGQEAAVAALLEFQSQFHYQFSSPSSMEQQFSYTQTGLFVSSQGITLLPIQAHPNEDGETPLHLAACLGAAQIVYLLLQHGAPPNLRDSTGWTPLHHAAAAGFDSVVRVFVDAHAQVRTLQKQHQELQPQWAGPAGASRGWGQAVDLNALDWEGNSPLHLACQIRNQELVCRLLFAGADANARDRQGLTPLQQGNLKMEDFFDQHMKPLPHVGGAQRKPDADAPKLQQQHQESYFQHFQQLIGANRSPFVRSVLDWLGRTLKGGSAADEGGGGGRGDVFASPDQIAI